MLARPCFLFHKTVLNKCAISIRGKFTMKIWPKYILRKRIHRFIQSTQILLPSTAQGSEVWENTDQVNTQSQRSDLSLDYLAIWYSSIVVPIYDVRYWPSLFGLDGWILAEFFYMFVRTGTKSWSINTQKRMRLISSHLDRTSLIIIYKGLIIQKKAFALLRIRYDLFNLRAGEKSQLCL